LKAAKFGIRIYELCESSSGYLLLLVVYTGKDTYFQSYLVTHEMKQNNDHCSSFDGTITGKRPYSLWIIFTASQLWPEAIGH
jgi:hypothetical protein